MYYESFVKNSHFYECVALEILIFRLATGSGYSNSHSLAPVMTPGLGRDKVGIRA